MIQYEMVKTAGIIQNVLEECMPIFPGLRSRISSLEDYSEKLAQHAMCVRMAEDDTTIGFAAFYANDQETKTGYITLIGVQSMCQGKGAGRSLMEYCLRCMKDAGMQYVKLEVDSDNIHAQGFYQHLGFSELGSGREGESLYLIREL